MEKTLDELVGYVRSKAEEEAAEIRSKADADFERSIAEADENIAVRLDSQKKNLLSESEKRVNEFERQEKAKDRKKLTEYASFLADRLFEECAARLNAMSEKEFSEFFAGSVKGLPLKGVYTVVPGEYSKDKLKKDLISSCESGDLSLILSDSAVKDDGGFVLTSGKVEYSFLFSDILEEVKKTEKPLLLSKIVSCEV